VLDHDGELSSKEMDQEWTTYKNQARCALLASFTMPQRQEDTDTLVQYLAVLEVFDHLIGYENSIGIALCRAADAMSISILDLRTHLFNVAHSSTEFEPSNWLDWLGDDDAWESLCDRIDLPSLIEKERFEGHDDDQILYRVPEEEC